MIAAVQPDPDSVTPGLYGFLVVFVLAVVTWLLLRNLTARLRRLRYREDQRLAGRGRQDQPGADQPGADQPGADQPGADQPGADQPESDRPG
jgi:hypothetical protein